MADREPQKRVVYVERAGGGLAGESVGGMHWPLVALAAVALALLALSAPAPARAVPGPPEPMTNHIARKAADFIFAKHFKKAWHNTFFTRKLSCRRDTAYRRVCAAGFASNNLGLFAAAARISKKPRGERFFYRGVGQRYDFGCVVDTGRPQGCEIGPRLRFRGSGKLGYL